MTRYAAGAIVAFLAGAIASVTGFGIGSILSPFLGITIGIKLAVAAVTMPHLCGTLFRFWTLRQKLDKEVLGTFGVMSAVGAIAGALLHVYTQSPALKILLAALLISAGVMGVAGLSGPLLLAPRDARAPRGGSGRLGGRNGHPGGGRPPPLLASARPQ